jgi:hypothetical protein
MTPSEHGGSGTKMLGAWAMVPCLVDAPLAANLAAKVRRVFADDYRCFGDGIFPEWTHTTVIEST